MRKLLKPLLGQRLRFNAEVKQFGKKTAYKGTVLVTLLLINLKLEDSDEVLSDHLWMTAGKWSSTVSIGDTIAFNARVDSYTKGYKGYKNDIDSPIRIDYRLVRPTKVKVDKLSESP